MKRAFEIAHEAFLNGHLSRRRGERKGRLERGHAHAEKLFLRNVWWPLYRNFEHLHPEYEVPDWRGRPYFGDFAFLPGRMKLLIEIKGYASHVQEMDRRKYSNELNRELFLQTLGYRIVSFAYDDVESRPDLCRNLLDSLIRRYVNIDKVIPREQMAERELIRFSLSSLRPITTKQAATLLQVSPRTASKHIQSLCAKGWLRPILSGTGARIRYYELVPGKEFLFS